jgi:hypothetical protein
MINFNKSVISKVNKTEIMYISGEVAFSALSRKITKLPVKNSSFAFKGPKNVIVLDNPHLNKNENAMKNPSYAALSNFIDDYFFSQKTEGKYDNFMVITSKGYNLDAPSDNIKLDTKTPLQKELVANLKVTLQVAFVKSKDDNSIYYVLTGITVDEPIRYYK